MHVNEAGRDLRDRHRESSGLFQAPELRGKRGAAFGAGSQNGQCGCHIAVGSRVEQRLQPPPLGALFHVQLHA